MKIALIICSYERPEYLDACIGSLNKLQDKPDKVILVDDASKDDGVSLTIVMTSYIARRKPIFILKKERKGIKDSLLQGFDKAFELGCDIAINLDPDTIVKPDFIARLVDLKQRFPDRIISGFNCNHPRNPVLFDGEDYVERRHCNGINMCIDKAQYETIVRPALLKEGNWDFNSTHDKNFIITKPSVVQHTGADCSTMGHIGGDVACDY